MQTFQWQNYMNFNWLLFVLNCVSFPLHVLLQQLLLGYLPTCRDLWEKELTENRQKYFKLKEELLLSPVRC